MIYFIADGQGHIKIGVAENVHTRLSQLQTGNAYGLSIVKTIELVGSSTTEDYWLESRLHEYFINSRIRNSEWFICDEKLQEFLDESPHIVQTYRPLIPSNALVKNWPATNETPIEAIREYLDTKTYIELADNNGITTIEQLKRCTSKYTPRGIGAKRLETIEEALQLYDKHRVATIYMFQTREVMTS